tara:strand:+ start:7281 stop:8030 length:750 start_codon:yes stop_codon:yes gene_type:complete
MNLTLHPSVAIQKTKENLYNLGKEVFSGKWQAIDTEVPMWELFNHNVKCAIPQTIEEMVKEVKPNLPWADDHFEERVGGLALNPPPSNEWWPFAQRGNNQFKADEKFSHTYPERLWPPHREGIRYRYGDMQDVVQLLEREPFTRQAFLPIWFPEDTGANEGQRVPCTIGYQFIRRDDYLHVFYFIRSCDYLRHFRDDIYLAMRKAKWVLETLQGRSKKWDNVKLGIFDMKIVSLHVFSPEREILKQKNK